MQIVFSGRFVIYYAEMQIVFSGSFVTYHAEMQIMYSDVVFFCQTMQRCKSYFVTVFRSPKPVGGQSSPIG